MTKELKEICSEEVAARRYEEIELYREERYPIVEGNDWEDAMHKTGEYYSCED